MHSIGDLYIYIFIHTNAVYHWPKCEFVTQLIEFEI